MKSMTKLSLKSMISLTFAELDNSKTVLSQHISEAIQYRSLDRSLV